MHNGHILGAAALVALPLQILSWPSLTPVTVVAALAVIGLRRTTWSKLPAWLPVLSILLVAFAAASALWSLNPPGSLKMAWWLLGTFAAGLVLLAAALGLSPDERRTCQDGLVLGFLAGLALLELMVLTEGRVLEYVRHESFLAPFLGAQRPIFFPTVFDTAMSFVTLLAWPVIAILVRRRGAIVAIVVGVLALIVVLQGASTTSKIAFILGGPLFLLARLAPRIATWVFCAALAVGIVAAPVLLRPEVLGWAPGAVPLLQKKQSSLTHRLAIWQFAIEKIDERPVLGWGLDSSRWMPGGHDRYGSDAEILPLHPHDAALQLRLDLGIPGVLLGACFVLGLARGIGRARGDRNTAALAFALIVVASILALVSYNLWHVWWLTMLWFSAVSMVVSFAPPAERDDRRAPHTR